MVRVSPLLILLLVAFTVPTFCDGAETTFRFRCETLQPADGGVDRLANVELASRTPGELVHPRPQPNKRSWKFDGRSAIAHIVPSNAEGFAENFTWEGFFLSPDSNRYATETGIADRFVTQFAFDKGNWTRLAIGLVADDDNRPRLSIELEGFDGRTFGLGDRVVAPGGWRHFALVHEGTAAAARIRWYLDYRLTGELFLGGQANQNTLRPPGSAPITIGARLQSNGMVNRGFEGYLDEIRLTPRPLGVAEFLRCEGAVLDGTVETIAADLDRDTFWEERHRWAKEQASAWAPKPMGKSTIDDIIEPGPPISDASFLRRLSLTVRGRIPSLPEVTAFLADKRPDRRLRAIDRMLASPEWADGWVGYWQDVLAENPSVVFPTLNNSGAFRQWIYDSFRSNKPYDRFVSELISMETRKPGSAGDDGPAGFALATGNDVPMAMRSHVALKAFAAVDLKCARCHDSPVDDFQQADLFLLASYLNGDALKVPATSVAAVAKANQIETSLTAGQSIAPTGLRSIWLAEPEEVAGLKTAVQGPRGELAAVLTSPRNRRFSDVIVNRVWKIYFGDGLVEPVDRWNDHPAASHPALLHLLSADFVRDEYDLKQLARTILTSRAWQSQRPKRRRMSAEQLVDSLFVAAGKQFGGETLGVHATDPGAVQLPQPRRAWQLAALPNERDRPALGMPVNQTIVDMMRAFGWSGSRQQPRSEREQLISAQQPLILLNGLLSQRIVRLSDQSAITQLCLEPISLRQLVERLFLTVLGRYPDESERQDYEAYLFPGHDQRRTGKPARPFAPLSTFQPDWRKHLEPEQTRLMLEAQQRVAKGEPPTERLTQDFREAVEDVLWVLINSPEFVVTP